MLVLSFLMVAGVVSAVYNSKNPLESTGLNETAGVYGGVTADKPEVIIGKIIGAALAFLGVAFFVLMIYGGYTWMFAMGNEQTATKAKDIIIAAVIGLVIVLMAYAITSYLGGVVGPVKPPATP